MGVSAELAQRARARVGDVVCKKWRIERVLGVGGMAAVYAAVHHNQNRVALKMLHPEVAVDDNVKTRFLREGYVANTVDHPGAVHVFDNDVTDEGVAFLVMELLDGESLEDRAARAGPVLPLPEVLALGEQLLDVLAAAHDKGIIHRDIKPDNLLLTTSGQLKVLDFGIARLRELSAPQGSGTGVGSFMGTPAFMAPEQARGRWNDVDARSDLWAVGATMFALLTGHNVHQSETVNDQLVLAATTPAPSLGEARPDLPPSVVALVDRALAYDKADRWPDARSMRAALREIAEEVPFAETFSVPRIRIAMDSADREADTIAASAAVVDEITSRAHSGNTTAAVTSSRSGAGSVMRPARRWLGVVLVAAALAVVAVLAFSAGQRDRAAEAPARPAAAAAAATAPPLAAPATATERAAGPTPDVVPAVEAPPEPSGANAPEPAAKPHSGKPIVAKPAPNEKPAPATATAKPAKPASPPATAGTDLYDKRY